MVVLPLVDPMPSHGTGEEVAERDASTAARVCSFISGVEEAAGFGSGSYELTGPRLPHCVGSCRLSA